MNVESIRQPAAPFRAGARRGEIKWRRCRKEARLRPWASAKRGGARRDRTADLIIANDALSQLSYGPVTAALTRDIEKVWAADKRTAIYSPWLCRVKNGEKWRLAELWPGTSLV